MSGAHWIRNWLRAQADKRFVRGVENQCGAREMAVARVRIGGEECAHVVRLTLRIVAADGRRLHGGGILQMHVGELASVGRGPEGVAAVEDVRFVQPVAEAVDAVRVAVVADLLVFLARGVAEDVVVVDVEDVGTGGRETGDVDGALGGIAWSILIITRATKNMPLKMI